MHFLIPILLLGIAGAIVPWLIHRLHRRRARVLAWGAMQFLRTPAPRLRRRRTIEQWLLLAVRMLVVAAFALMLAGPRVRAGGWTPNFESGEPLDLVVILDNSLSTGRPSGGRTVFDREIQTVGQILRGLGRSDSVGVVVAGHAPRALGTMVQASDDQAIGHLQEQVERLNPGLTDCSIPQAIATAGQLVQIGAHARKVILIVSDHQRLKWHVGEDAAWEEAVAAARPGEIISLPIVPDTGVFNATIQRIGVEPRFIGASRPLRIVATARDSESGPIAGITARLSIDGREIAGKPVPPLAPGTSTEISFDLQSGIGEIGSHVATVALDPPGALAAGSRGSTAINILPQRPVLIIDGQFSDAGGLPASRFLQAAVQPDTMALLEATVVPLGAASSQSLDRYACVVLNDCPTIPPPVRDRLVEYAQTGHGIWCILGPRTRESLIENDLATAGLLSADGAKINSADVSPTVGDFNEPIIAAVARNQRNALAGAQVRQWWSLHVADRDAQALVTTPDGDPLCLSRAVGSAGGQFVLWTTSVDGTWNNLHLMPNFVPLVTETIFHLMAPQFQGLENRGLVAGEPIHWVGLGSSTPGKIDVMLPDGKRVQRQAIPVNGRWLMTFPDTFDPGVYRLSFPDASIPPVSYAVNPDPRWLDPATLSRDDVAWLVAHQALNATRSIISASHLDSALHQGHETGLWWILGGLVLLLLVLETWLGRRMTARAIETEGSALIATPIEVPAMARRSA